MGFEVRTNFNKALPEWNKRHRDSLARAFRAVAFQLLKAERERLRKGVEPARAPLTAAIAATRGRKALSAFANMPAYEVHEGDRLSAKIGFSAAGSRRKRPLPLEMIKQVLGGRNIRIDERVQAEIALKARKRGASNKRLLKLIPEEGKRLRVPRRDVMALIGASELPQVPGWLSALYDRAMKGERWGNNWVGEL